MPDNKLIVMKESTSSRKTRDIGFFPGRKRGCLTKEVEGNRYEKKPVGRTLRRYNQAILDGGEHDEKKMVLCAADRFCVGGGD
jgi:hypothetical protein